MRSYGKPALCLHLLQSVKGKQKHDHIKEASCGPSWDKYGRSAARIRGSREREKESRNSLPLRTHRAASH